MTNIKTAIVGSVITLVAFILSVVSSFLGFLLLPLLNGTTTKADGVNISSRSPSNAFLETSGGARSLLETVFPILLVLIPMMVLIGGIVVTVLLAKQQ